MVHKMLTLLIKLVLSVFVMISYCNAANQPGLRAITFYTFEESFTGTNFIVQEVNKGNFESLLAAKKSLIPNGYPERSLENAYDFLNLLDERFDVTLKREKEECSSYKQFTCPEIPPDCVTSTPDITTTNSVTRTKSFTKFRTSTKTHHFTVTRSFTKTGTTPTITATETTTETPHFTKTDSFTKTMTTPTITATETTTETPHFTQTRPFTKTMTTPTITETETSTKTSEFTRTIPFTKTMTTPTITETETSTKTSEFTRTSPFTKTMTTPTITETETSTKTSEFTRTSSFTKHRGSKYLPFSTESARSTTKWTGTWGPRTYGSFWQYFSIGPFPYGNSTRTYRPFTRTPQHSTEPYADPQRRINLL